MKKVMSLYGALVYAHKVRGYCDLHKCYMTATNIRNKKGKCKICKHMVSEEAKLIAQVESKNY